MNKNHVEKHDDEIDLLKLVHDIWQYKLYIIAFVFCVSVATVVYTLSLDNQYKSATVLKPNEQTTTVPSLGLGALASFAGVNLGSGSSIYADIAVLLNSKDFFAEFVKRNELAPKLVEDSEILTTEGFKLNENYQFYKLLRKRINFSEDKLTKYITVTFEFQDSAFAQHVLQLLLKDVSNVLRAKHLENVDQRIESYKLEIYNAADMTLKIKLSEVVANLIQSKVFARTDQYFGFSVITEPSKPDPKDKEGPQRAKLCIIAFMGSFLISIFACVVFITLKNNIVLRDKETIG